MNWLLKRLSSHYILALMIITRFIGFLGGSLTIYYVNLTLPQLTGHTHFDVIGLTCTVLAVVVTVVMALWETRRLRRVLKLWDHDQFVQLNDAIEAGREAVQFCGTHHVHEAIVVPLVTTLPACLGMWLLDGVGPDILIHIVIATFLGISTSLLSTFFVIEKGMEPVIHFLLDRGVPIAYGDLPASSLRVRMNVSFSVIIVCTALMIGALANQRALDIIRHPEAQQQMVADLQRHILYIFVVAVLLGFGLSRVLAASVATRIATLVAAMKRVEEGSLSERLQPTGNDEVDGLTRQFNAMVDHLAQSDYTIRDLNVNLERKVHRRTRQLTKSRRTLKRSLKQLRDYDRLKTQFFSNISHELRTPLTMILAPVERILQKGESLPPGVVGMLETVRLNGRRLLELINRLLDFSKLEAGQMRLTKVPVDVNQLIQNLATAARPLAEQRGIELTVRYGENLPPAMADADKLDIILSNLLSNAIKFTPAGGQVKVETQLDGDRVRVSVADTGIGLAAADQQKIFERFVQVDGSSSREFSGTGLGLSLVKELVELHGGQIQVESCLGEGARFWFEIPLGDVCESERAAEVAPSVARSAVRFADLEMANIEEPVVDAHTAATASDRSTVLVVDDTADMRMLLGEILSDDYRVLFARDGAEGEQMALAEHPDLIISDVMMPHVDGYELCRRIKTNPQTAAIPFVMLTAKVDLDMKIEGLELGADDYLAKPFEEKELKARARSLLKLRRLHQDLDKRNKEIEGAYNELASVQSQLVQAEKMSSVGQLVAGLAHEINNSINAVYNGIKPLAQCTQSLETRLIPAAAPDGAPAALDPEASRLFRKIHSLAKVIENGASRAMRIVTDLRTFSHPGNEGLSEFDLHEALDMCLNLLSNQIRDRITIHKNYGSVGTVFGPSGQLNQVFMNILNNAQQAIPDCGEITISTRCDDDTISVSVQDTGGGIPEETLGKIFDPFFTTKDPGVGTGLGLSLSYGIISKLGGSIQCRSTVGEGTEFIVKFPVATKTANQTSQGTPVPIIGLTLGEMGNEAGCPVC